LAASCAVRGTVLQFRANPFDGDPAAAYATWDDGLVIVEAGRVAAVGAADALLPKLAPGTEIHTYPGHLVMAGFVDAHVHYPQVDIIASYGEQLLDWLEKYTFPAESRYCDRDHADRSARVFLKESLRNGVTTSAVYCTVHPQSVDAFFEACEPYGLRMIAGKVLMDRNAPDTLTDTARSGYDESKALIERWHGKGRAQYALTPRFAPTSTPEQLELAGALRAEFPDIHMQTHVSENRKEVAWVRELFPDCPDYLGVYEKYGLLGPRSVLGHGIWLSERERAVIRETGSAIAHCPTSNLFVGSGLFDMETATKPDERMLVGLASDVGGGTSLSMFATMRSAYEIAQLQDYSLHPLQAYYLATLGSAKSLYIDDKVGNLAPGLEADMVVVDLRSTPLIAHRMAHASSFEEALFVQMILADDRAIRATYAAGRKVYERDEDPARAFA